MDLYDEKEHVISSDEYSGEDDDDDALLNEAIRAQHPSKDFISSNKQSQWQMEQEKQKQLSSLIRRNKISIIYKNKSIKWLNNKKQREHYKKHIPVRGQKQNISDNITNTKTTTSEKELVLYTDEPTDSYKIKTDFFDPAKVVSIDDDDENNDNSVVEEVHSVLIKENVKQQKSQESIVDIPDLTTPKFSENVNQIKSKIGNCEFDVKNDQQQKQTNPNLSKIGELAEKRARSSSPPVVKDNNDIEGNYNATKKYRMESPQFYKKINEMFPKFEEISTNHIDTITNSSLTATEDKMKSILNEIQTLNEILHTKEVEWNRLLHLKMIKEEIYLRLSQKKHVLQLKENYTKARSQNTLSELKELELYLSDKNAMSSETNLSSTSVQQLIENRANMKAEDLEREKSNTSRLHSLLVSRNMLHGVDTSQNVSLSNGDSNCMAKTNKNFESYQHYESRSLLNNRGRQGQFKDVKSIIADFREKNPELLPRVGKRIKSSELNPQIRNFSIPFCEKTASIRPQYLQFAKDNDSAFYPPRNSIEEISITPITGSAKTLPSHQDIDFANTMNSQYKLCLDGNYRNNNVKGDFDARLGNKNIEYPLCQECKTHESRFVCAGCGNQWYCSKKCQISAWDIHSEICTD